MNCKKTEQILRKKWCNTIIEKLDTRVETEVFKTNPTEILKMKSTISEIKNTIEDINSRIDEKNQ